MQEEREKKTKSMSRELPQADDAVLERCIALSSERNERGKSGREIKTDGRAVDKR